MIGHYARKARQAKRRTLIEELDDVFAAQQSRIARSFGYIEHWATAESCQINRHGLSLGTVLGWDWENRYEFESRK